MKYQKALGDPATKSGGAIAIFIQLAYAFIVTRISGKYSFNEKINEGVVSVGILMAFLSICIGLLNAGSMSY
jgi:putative membrane protein